MTWPRLSPAFVTVHTYGPLSIGLEIGGSLVGTASATYPAASTAIFVPFSLPAPLTAAQLFTYNGATASGNIDVGLYAADGTRLVSSGSTAQAGTNTLQAFDITDTELGPGNYYLAIALDNTTGTLFRTVPAARYLAGVGCFQQASAFALPATATFATMAQVYLPVFGFSTRAVL